MSLTVLSDGCHPGAELDVDVGLSTSLGSAGLWDVALWDAGLWGPDVVWTSVADRVRSVSTTRGFSRGWGTWSAGKITVVLDNRDGELSPDNLDPGSPFVAAGVSSIRPGVPIRVRLTIGGVTYQLFYGYVTSWGESWAGHAPRVGDALVTVEGVDEWGRLARAKGFAVGSVGAGDTFGQRVNRILDAAGFTGDVDADSGYVTFQATDLSAERVTELNDAARAEGGAVWAGTDGSIIARDRYSLVEDLRSITVQATFGDGDTDAVVCWMGSPWTVPDGAGESPWTELTVAPLTDERVVNRAVYTPSGLSAQTYIDPTSVALYGDRTETLDDLPCQTEPQALALATWRVLVSKDPEALVERVSFRPRCDLDVLGPLLLGLEIRDLVRIRLRPPTDYATHELDRYCHVSGIQIVIDRNDLTVSFPLESATAYRAFAASRWDIGTWGASDLDPTGALWFV